MAKNKLLIDAQKPPRVLMIGNGLLLLNNGIGWSDLIKTLAPDPTDIPDVGGIPYAMQPEAVCGTDVENVQRLIAENIKSKDPHEILRQLAFMDFDAILTTNYTYEIEEALTGGSWSENKRVKSHTTLYGSPHVRYNTYKCNLVKDINDRELPVFHIHGEQARKHSMVLSYYKSASKLLNRFVEIKDFGNRGVSNYRLIIALHVDLRLVIACIFAGAVNRDHAGMNTNLIETAGRSQS